MTKKEYNCIDVRQSTPSKSDMLPIAEVANKNKLRWFDHVMRREEESMLKVVMKLNMKGKETKMKNKSKVARQHR